MNKKAIYFWILIPFVFTISFFFLGKFINYTDTLFDLNVQSIARYLTDYADIVALFLALTWMTYSLCRDISTIKLKLKWIGTLNVSALSITTLMYILHDVYNFSSINNNLCDAGWNFVTLTWIFCIAINYGYLRILTYRLNEKEDNNER